MNAKYIYGTLFGLIILISSIQPAQAFWPLDLFSKSNQEQTTAQVTTQTSTLIDKLIEKFNLNQDEVEQLVTDYRTERRERMQSQYEERLNQAVTEDKITEAQKQLILEKHNQLQSQWDAQSQERQQHRQEMQTWATDNNIDLSYLGFGTGMGRGGQGSRMKGQGRGMVRGQ